MALLVVIPDVQNFSSIMLPEQSFLIFSFILYSDSTYKSCTPVTLTYPSLLCEWLNVVDLDTTLHGTHKATCVHYVLSNFKVWKSSGFTMILVETKFQYPSRNGHLASSSIRSTPYITCNAHATAAARFTYESTPYHLHLA